MPATKVALLNMSKTLSSELLPRGVRVNAVSPGPIDTPLYDKAGTRGSVRCPWREVASGRQDAGGTLLKSR
nr:MULTISPECIES: SDR family oxidoreductase [unclassified Pseudomonas]